MSCHFIYYAGGSKMMRPVGTAEEYRALRDSERNRRADKRHMAQMNYSCLPNADGSLRGSTRVSGSVGMDFDFDPSEPDYARKMADVPTRVFGNRERLGLLMLERSATKGYHVAFRRRPGLTQEENLRWAAELLGVAYDKGAKDVTRVFFTPPTDRLLFLSDELFDNKEAASPRPHDGAAAAAAAPRNVAAPPAPALPPASPAEADTPTASPTESDGYLGLPYAAIVRKWWELFNDGREPVKSNRDVLTFELAVNLRHICGFDRDVLARAIPCYDGFPETQKMKCIDSALAEKRTQLPRRLKEVLAALREERPADTALVEAIDEAAAQDDLFYFKALPPLPQGVRESVEAVGPALAMPAIVAVCPAIGMLATGVRLDVHGKLNTLNLIGYIAGDFASGKGGIDPVVEAWTDEVRQMDKLYQRQEEVWRAKKRAAKNKMEQPEEPKLPVRCLTLNNTVANLAERLANTEGKHAFSFTPEADTVAQKWKSAMSDFSVMLRQAYDGTGYEREARSAEAVNVHIDRLLWNVVMCGTPDALYRVVTNYTDGFQSRIAIARTPDNTFTPLSATPYVLTDRQAERIRQVAHLLPLMRGDIVLTKLEERGREWLERVRLDAMKNDDKVRARQRFRICPTTMRMMCCLMLCRVAEELIGQHGTEGAEAILRQDPLRWRELIVGMQTPQLLSAFDVLADSQLDNALHFFRSRIEEAFESKEYSGGGERVRRGKNDSIFARLDTVFSFEQALQQAIALKGGYATRESTRQMLKNWVRQELVEALPGRKFRKTHQTP